MYIEKLQIKNFRSFGEEVEIPLVRGINCIAGYNGTGKSTILAVLGNCGELKKGQGRHINGQQFRGEYSDIIKYDASSDTPGVKAKLHFNAKNGERIDPPYSLEFRATVQTHQSKVTKYRESEQNSELYEKVQNEQETKRYRLLPVKTPDRNTESKITWPVYYLGLSRLYPVGESQHVVQKKAKLDDSVEREFAEVYSQILGIEDLLEGTDLLRLSDVPKKSGAGVRTAKYGPLSNSAGQDNLAQILLTFLSFKKLKEEQGEAYRGGLVLIDELEATLHPFAQIRLYREMKRWCKEFDLQVVFTTHSLDLLREIYSLESLTKKNDFVSVLYLTRSRGALEVEQAPALSRIVGDLRAKLAGAEEPIEVPILVEDSVAEMVVRKILNRSDRRFKLRFSGASLGAFEIAKLCSAYSTFFIDGLVVLDPDMGTVDKRAKLKRSFSSQFVVEGQTSGSVGLGKRRRVLFLPGSEPIETQCWKAISVLDSAAEFYSSEAAISLGVTKASLVDEFRSQLGRADDELCFHKNWFEKLAESGVAEMVVEEWMDQNADEVTDFLRDFSNEYDRVLGDRNLVSPFNES